MKLHLNLHLNPDIEAGRVKMWGLKCKLKCGHHILTPPAGLSLPELASAGLGWPRLASAGVGWPRLASARLRSPCAPLPGTGARGVVLEHNTIPRIPYEVIPPRRAGAGGGGMRVETQGTLLSENDYDLLRVYLVR